MRESVSTKPIIISFTMSEPGHRVASQRYVYYRSDHLDNVNWIPIIYASPGKRMGRFIRVLNI